MSTAIRWPSLTFNNLRLNRLLPISNVWDAPAALTIQECIGMQVSSLVRVKRRIEISLRVRAKTFWGSMRVRSWSNRQRSRGWTRLVTKVKLILLGHMRRSSGERLLRQVFSSHRQLDSWDGMTLRLRSGRRDPERIFTRLKTGSFIPSRSFKTSSRPILIILTGKKLRLRPVLIIKALSCWSQQTFYTRSKIKTYIGQRTNVLQPIAAQGWVYPKGDQSWAPRLSKPSMSMTKWSLINNTLLAKWTLTNNSTNYSFSPRQAKTSTTINAKVASKRNKTIL